METALPRSARSAPVEYDALLSPDPRSARAARQFVRDRLTHHGFLSETAELVVSELMANVVQHARTPVRVRLRLEPASVRVELHDGSSIVPAMAEAAADAERGRGLFIVAAVSRRWNIDTTPTGKCVWIELDAEAA